MADTAVTGSRPVGDDTGGQVQVRPDSRTRRGERERSGWIVPLLCSAAALALLLPKPLHIDDPFYLAIADHILRDPAHPYSFVFNWWGRPELAYNLALSPPLFTSFTFTPLTHSATAARSATVW